MQLLKLCIAHEALDLRTGTAEDEESGSRAVMAKTEANQGGIDKGS